MSRGEAQGTWWTPDKGILQICHEQIGMWGGNPVPLICFYVCAIALKNVVVQMVEVAGGVEGEGRPDGGVALIGAN